MKAAAEVEAENYCKMTRVEEIAEFASKIGAKKLGIATCVGLISEALCTTLVTKDRVLGHNPAAALYQAGSYYSKLLK